MKNTYIFNKVLGAGMLALLLTGCTDSFLDKEPDPRTEIDTPEKAILLLTGSYPDHNYGWFCELSSDNVIDMNSVHLPASTQSAQNPIHYNLAASGRQDDELFRFEAVKSSTSSDTPGGHWTSTYTTINSVNEVLAAIDKMEAEGQEMTPELTAAKAEALLIRAYCHFTLVAIFSQAYKNDELSRNDIGIPYVTEPFTVVDDHYDRSNVTETYRKIREDLEWGVAHISNVNYQQPKWHFNVDAAHAFACRFYLFIHEWDKAIQQANAVLGTDNVQLQTKFFDYAPLDDCSYLSDFANVWQSPYIENNIMLIDTYSTIARKARYRYEQGGLAARAIYYHNAPMWRGWAANPSAIVSGLFGSRDYGWYPGWIGEQFQYTDKVAGIGYAHTIRREFTIMELLLERAEAKVMLGDLTGASEDLCTYHLGTMNFSQTTKDVYAANNYMTPLTDALIQSWFARNTASNYNCFDDWNFMQRMSPDLVVSADAVPYMNCVNYFRRFETNFTGKRFFDLKRWGIEYTHEYGLNNELYTMTWDDPRRALEVPQDAIAAGLEPSRPAALTVDTMSTKTVYVPDLTELIMN